MKEADLINKRAKIEATTLETDSKSLWVNIRRKFGLNSKQALFVVIVILIILAICVVTSITVAVLSADNNEYTDDGVVRIISRDEWSAQPPRENLTALKMPVGMVIIAHTVTESCKTMALCINRVHAIQEQHINADIDDIGYNFLVGGDGAAYEGRGWDKVGAHTIGFNSKSIGVAFIGTFITQKPDEKQLKAARLLLKEGVRQGILAPDYKLYGARQLTPTESPGQALYDIIKTWPQWSEEI